MMILIQDDGNSYTPTPLLVRPPIVRISLQCSFTNFSDPPIVLEVLYIVLTMDLFFQCVQSYSLLDNAPNYLVGCVIQKRVHYAFVCIDPMDIIPIGSLSRLINAINATGTLWEIGIASIQYVQFKMLIKNLGFKFHKFPNSVNFQQRSGCSR